MLIALKCVSLTLLEPSQLVQGLLYLLHTCMHTYLPTHPPTYLPTYPPTHLLTHLPTHPSTYPPTHLPTCLPTYLPSTYTPTYIYIYIYIYSENCFIHNWIIWESWLTSKLTEVKLTLYQAMEAQRGAEV
jgi:hypothetical protein